MFNGYVFHVKNAPITVTSEVRRGNNGLMPSTEAPKIPKCHEKMEAAAWFGLVLRIGG